MFQQKPPQIDLFSPMQCTHAHMEANSNREVLTAASLVNIEFSQAGSA